MSLWSFSTWISFTVRCYSVSWLFRAAFRHWRNPGVACITMNSATCRAKVSSTLDLLPRAFPLV